MIEYDSEKIYIDSACSLKDKIKRVDAIILALYDAALASVGDEGIKEYWLDDGQIKIKKVYSGSASILMAIKNYEAIRQMYISKLNGRVVRLVDGKNLTGRRNERG
jgi:hypothetical protein